MSIPRPFKGFARATILFSEEIDGLHAESGRDLCRRLDIAFEAACKMFFDRL
jgi:hypothetical protein